MSVNKMVKCCIPFCTSVRCETSGIYYHEFPSDFDVREQWLESIRKARESYTDWIPTDRAVVCSLHFQDCDYKSNIKRKLLLRTAVPSVFPPVPPGVDAKAVAKCRKTELLPKRKFLKKQTSNNEPVKHVGVRTEDGCSTDLLKMEKDDNLVIEIAKQHCESDSVISVKNSQQNGEPKPILIEISDARVLKDIIGDQLADKAQTAVQVDEVVKDNIVKKPSVDKIDDKLETESIKSNKPTKRNSECQVEVLSELEWDWLHERLQKYESKIITLQTTVKTLKNEIKVLKEQQKNCMCSKISTVKRRKL